MEASDDLDGAVRRLVAALRGRDPADPVTRLLLAAVDASGHLRGLDAAEARRRVDAAVRVLGALAPDPDTKGHVRPRPDTRRVARPEPPTTRMATTPPSAARRRVEPPSGAHCAPEALPRPPAAVLSAARPPEPGTRSHRRLDGRPPGRDVTRAVSDFARAWAELGRGTLPSEPIELLGELVRTGVPEGPEAVRFHLALVRGVDHALSAARHLPCEAPLRERARPILRAAIDGAAALGVRVHPPADGQAGQAPCPVHALPAFGEPAGGVVWVDQHGFLLADGRVEAASVRLGCGAGPPWLDALSEGYAAVVRGASLQPDGAAQVRAYRGWLDELPGVPDGERRCTTLRYAATAVFALAESDPGARAAFDRLAQALEAAGSFVIPLQPDALSDARRYELVLRPGIGAPRVVRPGFQGQGQVVQQRARVLADPAWLGTMST